MPQDASHLRAKLEGITDNDLEWSLAGYAELYDTSLGHVGHSWEREEFDLDFKANKPIEISTTSLSVSQQGICRSTRTRVTAPWDFQVLDTIPGTFHPHRNIYPCKHPDFGLQL